MSTRHFNISAVSICATVFAAACSVSPAPAVDVTDDAITTSTVIDRAEQWVAAELHYCQAAHDAVDGDSSCWAFEGPSHRCDRESVAAWNAYRSDCSGFVTWAWGLPAVGDGGYVTGDFAPFDDSFSHVIAMDDLRPGDALNKVTNEHIVLFKEWIVRGERAAFLEEPGCSVATPYAHEFTSNVSRSGGNVVIDYEGSTPFTPIRLDGIATGGGPAPLTIDRTAIANDADGRLEIFFIDQDDQIEHIWQKAPDGTTGWSKPEHIGGKGKSLAVARNTDGRLVLFFAGTNDRIYHDFQTAPNGSWHGAVELGGSAKQLAIGTNADGRLELFYVGTNDHIYHNVQSAPGADWTGQRELDGQAKQLAVTNNPSGALELVYVGTNNHLYNNFQDGPNGGWHGQVELAGEAKQVALGNHPDGRVEIFYIGTDNALYHDYQTDLARHWSGEHGLGGEAQQISVATNADGRLELFYIGTNAALYHNYQTAPDGGWAGEASLGGTASQISTGANADGRLELFYLGPDAGLHHNWQTAPNAGWAGPHGL